ncbi:type II secretion system F family protein [Janibacter sp. G56]|uniref:type II secretion system F family protein n=1 Tax=Janibacter sp. G56 TaxID=3418717 RepID=UPI003D072F99
MSLLFVTVPGLVLALAALTALRGYHLMRSDPSEHLMVEDIALLKQAERDRTSGQSPLERLAWRLAARVKGLLPTKGIRALQRQIDLAGRPDGVTVDSLLSGGMRWLVLLSPGLLLFAMQGKILFVLLGLAIVVVLPLARLSGMARKRREQIDRDLPDFLDVLAVTVSAGIGFRSALATVADRFGGPLSEEIQTCLHQMANGASLRSAFLSLRARTDSDAMNEFVTAYLQSEELGAPLVDTLNQIATEMRRATAQRMRQHAAKVEPRVTLVVTTVMVPGSIVLLAGGMFLAFGGDELGKVFGG